MGRVRFKTWVFRISKLLFPTVCLPEYLWRRFQRAGFDGDWVITSYTYPDGISAPFHIQSNKYQSREIDHTSQAGSGGPQSSFPEGRYKRNERKRYLSAVGMWIPFRQRRPGLIWRSDPEEMPWMRQGKSFAALGSAWCSGMGRVDSSLNLRTLFPVRAASPSLASQPFGIWPLALSAAPTPTPDPQLPWLKSSESVCHSTNTWNTLLSPWLFTGFRAVSLPL